MRALAPFAAILALAACPPAATVPAPVAMPATATLYDAGGAAFAPLARWRGRVVVLDFWASWCAECKRSVPPVARMAAAFAAEGLVVVGVNEDDDEGKARAAAAELGIQYPIAFDRDLALADQLGASQLPMLLVVDRGGAIVHRARRVDAETLAVVRRLLATSTAAR